MIAATWPARWIWSVFVEHTPVRSAIGPEDSGFEISATVFETLSGLSFNARSAWETIPMHAPSASTMGIRRS